MAPANAAGLRPGDVLTSVAGTPVSTWDVRVAIRGNLDKPMTIELERDGQPVTVQAEPMVLNLPSTTTRAAPDR